MKVAIHKPDFTGSFAEKWIEYCVEKGIDYNVVNCRDNNIFQILKDRKITHLLWHFSQNWKDLLTARNILFSAEMIGIKVFPDKYTSWHFDDKISQKYLLEALDINLVKTYVFYDREDASQWLYEHKKFPVVAKLRRGSGSTCVKLIKSEKQFLSYTSRMFSRGLTPQSSISHDFIKRAYALKSIEDLRGVFKKIYSRFYNKFFKVLVYPPEFGYIYFQDFVPNCSFDIRVVVINNKAYGIKRLVRKNDFRASGSGNIVYDVSKIDPDCVKKGFDISEKLKTQSIAIDFVLDEHKNPLVLEISYGFTPRAYDLCEGYWDKNLTFHKGMNILEYNIIEDLLKDN